MDAFFDFLTRWLWESWQVVLEAGPFMVVGFFVAGLIHAFVPMQQVVRHLGQPGLKGVAKAALLGAPLPLCSCSVIPVASAIRRQGASRGATASFLVSAPETGVDSIAISYVLLGPVMAVVRPVAAVLTAFVAGGFIERFHGQPQTSAEKTAPASDHSCCAHGGATPAPPPAPRLLKRIRNAAAYGYGRMFQDLGHWLLIGFLLAGLIAVLVPSSFMEAHLGGGLIPMLVMLAIGMPLYVCATASTPVAAALIAKGLSPGAALVFLLAGPATNATTMLIMGRELGRRSLGIYLLSISVVALCFGFALDAMLISIPAWKATVCAHHEGHSPWLSWIAALVLIGLMINGMRRHIQARRASRHQPVANSTPVSLSVNIPRRTT